MSNESAVVAIYDTHQHAEDAIKKLQGAGFNMKDLSIIGKGYTTEEQPIGFYTTGDRVKFWGGTGALWGGLWGLLFGAALFWVPGFGPLVVGGSLVAVLVNALEGAVVVGGLSAVGAALYSLGVPKNSIVKYETALKADKYLVIAHGEASEVEKARTTMDQLKATAEAVAHA
jgi:Protein of unknown function (DUF3341)